MRLCASGRSGESVRGTHPPHAPTMQSSDGTVARGMPGSAAPDASGRRDWVNPLEITVLGPIWRASFLFLRVAAPEFGAVALVELRLALGALVLLPFLWAARRRFPPALDRKSTR